MTNNIFRMFRGGSREDPLADPGSLAAWLAQQPANDQLGLQEAMIGLLEDMAVRQPKPTHRRVLAVLELDRTSGPIQERLLKQYLQLTLSESVRQRLWRACDDLACWFAYVYEHLLASVQKQVMSRKSNTHLHGLASRMFYYRGQQSKHSLFRFERWIPGRWQSLHKSYQTVVEQDLARIPFSPAVDSPVSEQYSAEEEYLQILLLQRLNSGNLNAQQVQFAAEWLRDGIHTLSLAPPLLEGGGFWLDLRLDEGLLVCKPYSTQGESFYLDASPLRRRIVDRLVEIDMEMKRGRPTLSRAEADRYSEQLQRLERLWHPQGKLIKRRGERVETDRPVTVAAGLVQITAALQGKESQQTVLNRRYHGGDPMEVACGLVQPLVRSDVSDMIEYQSEGASGWRMGDLSESGCRLVSQSREATAQQLGGLIGMQEGGGSRWKIGIIRRLTSSSGGQIELGIEFIAQQSVLISPKPAASRNTGYSVDGIDVSAEGRGFDALYLPPMQSDFAAPRRSMVVPAVEYGERRRFILNFGNSGCTVEMTAALERIRDCVWTSFEVVPNAE